MIQKLLLLAAAGAAGTLARYAIAGLTMRLMGSQFPWGTLAVNLLGCFLFGLIWTIGQSQRISPEASLIVLVGFMGAFTTFSSFAFETRHLLDSGRYLHASANLLFQNALGVAGVVLGIAVGRSL